jgi:hypothetical protein
MTVSYPTITNTGTISAGTGLGVGTINLGSINPNTVYTTTPGSWTPTNISTSMMNSGSLGVGGIHFSGSNYSLVISASGEITWNGPLSKNAQRFIQAVESGLNLKVVGERALSKNYRQALEKCLREIKSTDKESFIIALENEIAARKSKEVWRILTTTGDADE